LSAIAATLTMPVMADSNVATLTFRMSKGDEEAFREFHTQYFRRLFSYILVLTRGDEHAARDVAQDTLLRVVRHVRRFEENEFWDWLARLARSAAADHGRGASRYRRLLDLFAREPFEPSELMPTSDAPSALGKCLAELPEDHRALLTRKYEHRSSVRELAVMHGVSEEAIESRLARARRALREALVRHLRHENS